MEIDLIFVLWLLQTNSNAKLSQKCTYLSKNTNIRICKILFVSIQFIIKA